MTIVTDLLLAIAAASVWLGCVGFVRLRNPYDRLHCSTFVAVAGGLGVMLAGWVQQGASVSMLKVVFLVGFALLNGAALNHAIARAAIHRERSSKP